MVVAGVITVSHQTVRSWAEKFGRAFAYDIRRRSSERFGDKWHLDEAVVSIRARSTGGGAPSTRKVSSLRFWFNRP
jgi:putative transposase